MSDLPPSGASSGGLSGFAQQSAEAASGLALVRETGVGAADAIDAAFLKAGESLTRSLARAAGDGKISLSELASAVISVVDAFAKASGSGGSSGLGSTLAAAISSFAGARADGGPVAPGGAYLVGERGPELFRPSAAGEIAPASGGMGGGGAVVNVTIQGGGAPGLLRSEAQIAAALARAVALGGR